MNDVSYLLPELVLALTLAAVLLGEITYVGERLRLVTAASIVGLLVAFLETIFSYQYPAGLIFGGALSFDGFSLFFKLIFILLAFFSIIYMSRTQEIEVARRAEFCSLILAATLAMCLVASASDALLIFLSVLFLNVICTFLLAFGRDSCDSVEAAIKYFCFSAVASALLLYALAILFGTTRSLNLYEMHKVLAVTPLAHSANLVVFGLIFLALAFQVGSFPMSLVLPDVIEGAPTPVSAFVSVGSRAAGFALMIRTLIALFAQAGPADSYQWQVMGDFDWTVMLEIVSGITMLSGALLSVRQKRAKRLIGCLILVETGYLWMGVLVLDQVGIAALLYNLVLGLFALVGSFFVVSRFYQEFKSDHLSEMRGMLQRAVPESVCLILFLLCLTGSAPTPGFIGKFTLIGIAVQHQKLILAAVAVLASFISTLSVARLTFYLIGDFKQMAGVPKLKVTRGDQVFLAALMVPLILLGLFSDWVFALANRSLGFIFW